MDQRKVLLAREFCDDIKRKNKPIILSHCILINYFDLVLFINSQALIYAVNLCTTMLWLFSLFFS